MSTAQTIAGRTPAQALAAWPDGVPLAALWSGGSGEHARWTVLAQPSHVRVLKPGADPAAWARSLLPASAAKRDAIAPGWMACLGYELGGVFEPVARGVEASHGPLAVAVRCDDAWVCDHHRGTWHAVGSPPELEAAQPRVWRAGPLASAMGAVGYTGRAARAVEYIRAGDVYQVNLAHELSGPFHGSARGLFRDWVEQSGAWYGAYLEWDGADRRRAVLSASPELFLSFDPVSRRLVTRPMKGTRPAGHSAGELEAAEKDRAELTMIVDLMRNDLGRVCDLGSVRVERARSIERHDGLGVLQATATVVGTLSAGRTWWDVIAATFPGGSVTGAPKVRAMQIIGELEGRARGAYCGCVGFLSDSGAFQCNIAIRTAMIEGPPRAGTLDGVADGTISYSVGAGIVADSDPEAEWRETMDKAAVFLRCVDASARSISPDRAP